MQFGYSGRASSRECSYFDSKSERTENAARERILAIRGGENGGGLSPVERGPEAIRKIRSPTSNLRAPGGPPVPPRWFA